MTMAEAQKVLETQHNWIRQLRVAVRANDQDEIIMIKNTIKAAQPMYDEANKVLGRKVWY